MAEAVAITTLQGIMAAGADRTGDYIKFRIECRETSKNCGGFNLFGEKAGDYDQPIILNLEH